MKSKVHVQLYDSKEKRKLILMSARTLTEQLQSFSMLKEFNLEKKNRLIKLKSTMEEVEDLFNMIKMAQVRDVETQKTEKQPGFATKKEKLEVAKVDDLTKDLIDIERKLASLEI